VWQLTLAWLDEVNLSVSRLEFRYFDLQLPNKKGR
jgi:hypothetical protein